MSRSIASRLSSSLARQSLRASTSSTSNKTIFQIYTLSSPSSQKTVSYQQRSRLPSPRPRLFSTTVTRTKGIQPETADPAPPNSEAHHLKITPMAAELSESEYHDLADMYMETILARFEELAEKREDVDVEYSAGVLTFTYPSIGTYVINKQPPNKQIWLSSPRSGPKRFDYVVVGDGQHQKEGTASGDWVYLRDGTKLGDVFEEEIGADFGIPPAAH